MDNPIFQHKQIDDGYLIEIKITKVEKNKYYPEGIKYSLVAIERKTKSRLLCFDNGERKGHHIHKGKRELKYDFVNEWQLIKDFYNEYKKLKKRRIC